MIVLVGCEESQTVCIEFRKHGHDAYSNDIVDCSGGHPEWHLKMDVLEAIDLRKWDLIILHPPCTCLAVSGNAHYGTSMSKHFQRLQAIEWTKKLWQYAKSKCNRLCLENPVGVLSGCDWIPKPYYIQPWEFGHPESKKNWFTFVRIAAIDTY